MTVESLRLPPTNSDIVQALNDYACQQREAARYDTARVALTRALAMDPMQHALWGNYGCLMWNLGRLDEAEEPLRRATFLAPGHAPNWGNLGLLYSTMRRYDEAEVAFQRCIETADNPKDAMGAHWDRSLMRLEQGDWVRGFEDYDVRIELRAGEQYPKMPIPLWQGEPLDGKTLYVQAEQGLGDRILFSRYFDVIKARWPTCTIKACMNEALTNLFWDFRDIVEFMPSGVPWPDDLDYGSFQASLPRWLSPTVEDVPPDPGRILKRVAYQNSLGAFQCPEPRTPALKVGIAWTGNPTMIRNAERSIPLELMLSLGERPDVCLYGFQVGPGQERIEQLGAGQLIRDLGSDIARHGIVGGAVAIMNMDLIITACTSTAHIAGSLGVPTWVLLCHDPYWVWLQGVEERRTSVWYPSVRLYRQKTPNDWAGVLAEVRADLDKLCDAREASQEGQRGLNHG